MTEYPRLVYWYYNDGQRLFSKKNDKESLTKVYITDAKGEEILKTGQIAALGSHMRTSDPYFSIQRETGYTSRAKSYGKLRRDMEKNYPELKSSLKSIQQCIAPYGDYVYINMSYLRNYTNSFTDNKDIFMNENYIYKDKFTVELIEKLINYIPRDLMDQKEIKDYQQTEVPQLMAALKYLYPELYVSLLERSEKARKLDQKLTFVGKTARLQTLLPGKVELRLGYTDRQVFYWDGTVLTNKKQAYDGSTIEQTITPSDNTSVKVLYNSTVSAATVFLD